MIKTFCSVVAAAALGLALSSCASTTNPLTDHHGPSHAYAKARNIPSHGVALEGYCPVAYFAVDRPVRGKPEHASVHDGVTYHLVSAEAKAAFDAEPEKYVPAYGGWCAYGMAVEDKFPVDPRNFEIVDGRLMLFLRNDGVDARELWSHGNATDLTARADRHWRKVQG